MFGESGLMARVCEVGGIDKLNKNNMKIIIILISLILGFSIWYLLGWFVSNEPDMFQWPLYGKITYIVLSYIAANAIADILENDSII
jgi:hypothetical protein